jgi:hypothetical protein
VKTTQRYSHLSQKSLIAAANTATTALPLGNMMPKDKDAIELVAVEV